MNFIEKLNEFSVLVKGQFYLNSIWQDVLKDIQNVLKENEELKKEVEKYAKTDEK